MLKFLINFHYFQTDREKAGKAAVYIYILFPHYFQYNVQIQKSAVFRVLVPEVMTIQWQRQSLEDLFSCTFLGVKALD